MEAIKAEPEPEKPNAELRAAQAAVNKLQWIVESAMACLLEQRLRYPLNKIGILETFVPQKKIEVLSGVAGFDTIIISGIEYLKIHGLPSSSQDRLLGKCEPLKFNERGVLNNFTDLSNLSTKAQEERLEDYKSVHQNTVAGFLAHFVGSETFHRKPEVTVKKGVNPCVLQEVMSTAACQLRDFTDNGV